MSKFEVTMITYLDERGLVAEIYHDACLWVEISKKDEKVMMEFYSHPHQDHWEFPLEEAMKMLEETKTRFLIKSNSGTFLERMCPPDPQEVNAHAEKILSEIVNHPERIDIPGELKRFGQVIDMYEPSGRGARYDTEGEFICFLE